MVDEVQIGEQINAMVGINDHLTNALAAYKLSVFAGRWLVPGIGSIVYAADDVGRAEYEVDSWHTGALKWMTDGADSLRAESITWEAWANWGVSLANQAGELGNRLADAGLVTRVREFAVRMPKSMGIVLGTIGKAAADAAGSLLDPLIPWLIGAGALYLLVTFGPSMMKRKARG